MTESEVWIDQTLHGYSSGHRLLSTSAKLADVEKRTMLVLSDASGGRFADQDQGYLTGYPLPGASKYVVARTWPATGMTRPGCVWTQSLLIGFADLARLSSAEGILGLFRRPHTSVADFDKKLRLPIDQGRAASTRHDAADALLNALYLDPSSKIEMRAGDPADDEELLLAVWLQQWPRLRRAFRFCSSVGADRSTEVAIFDVQITGSSHASGRTVVAGSHPVVAGSVDPRLASAVQDLGTPGGLRSFLRKVGGDVSGGRSAMIALCQLHDALERASCHETFYSTALDAFDLLGPGQARAARAILLERALVDVGDVDDRTFAFICDGMAEGDAILEPEMARRVGNTLWRRSPKDFSIALGGEGPLCQFAVAAVAELDRESLAEAVATEPAIAAPLARARPDVLTLPRFWEAPHSDVGLLLGVVKDEAEDTVLGAIMSAGRVEQAGTVVRRFGSARALLALARANVGDDDAIRFWIKSIARDPGPLGEPLSSGKVPRSLAYELSKRVEPDAIPNNYGIDPWLTAALSEGTLGSSDEGQFAAFLMARALGNRSRSCAELLRVSFDHVHRALAEGIMPDAGWQMLEARLPWPMLWANGTNAGGSARP